MVCSRMRFPSSTASFIWRSYSSEVASRRSNTYPSVAAPAMHSHKTSMTKPRFTIPPTCFYSNPDSEKWLQRPPAEANRQTHHLFCLNSAPASNRIRNCAPNPPTGLVSKPRYRQLRFSVGSSFPKNKNAAELPQRDFLLSLYQQYLLVSGVDGHL